jgi:antitoxin component of RelBE/YafQ-DinJ toxin-antitoxin module
MNNLTFLQIFLIFDALIIGVVLATAIRHGLAHFKPEKHDAEKPQTVQLPPAVREHLIKVAQTNFENVLSRATIELQGSLKVTSAQLDKKLEKIGEEIIDDELKSYKASLEQLRKQAASIIVNAESETTEHHAELKAKLADRQVALEAEFSEHQMELAKRQAELEAKVNERQIALEAEFNERQAKLTKQQDTLETKLDEEIAAEKQLLIQQMDAKLSDAVATFLNETLRHNIDLGAQTEYLTEMLEEHKAELVKDISDES